MIMFDNEMRNIIIVSKSTTDAFHFVCDNADAFSGTADQDSFVRFSAFDFFGTGLCEFRIIAGIHRIGSAIDDFMSFFLQHLNDGFFDRESAVVTSKCDFHRIISSLFLIYYNLNSHENYTLSNRKG